MLNDFTCLMAKSHHERIEPFTAKDPLNVMITVVPKF